MEKYTLVSKRPVPCAGSQTLPCQQIATVPARCGSYIQKNYLYKHMVNIQLCIRLYNL